MKKTEREIFLDVKNWGRKKPPQKNSRFPSQQRMSNEEFSFLFWSPHYRHLINSVAKTLNENGSCTYSC